ncbi:MAG: RluA family pseudouridine synthase [Chloroflexi bacterium]|nr:RluA family pseudouridine synthase [Chloroflexota bacterium]MCL5074409.1 RluA family pseudouridine synthase [Chloroflexota bacterium]
MVILHKKVSVPASAAGTRLDKFLTTVYPHLSRSLIQKLIEAGHATVNGQPSKPSVKILPGDQIDLHLPPPEPTTLIPQPIPLDIVFENEDVLMINKPAGLVVHPAAGHRTDTLVNAILAYYPNLEIGSSLRPGIVHRLDKDTSGLLVIAKNDRAHLNLSRQIQERKILKEYIALLHGHLTPSKGLIEAPIGRHPKQRKLMAVVAEGREARTYYTVSEYMADYTLVRVRPETGRTHQIRVHFASIGHPVAGDRVYGRRHEEISFPRQFLHACRLSLCLPNSEQFVEFEAPLPSDLEEILTELRRKD